jgi:hypothetical protein
MRKIVKTTLLISIVTCLLVSWKQNKSNTDVVIATGQMPNVIKDKDNKVNLVYGNGDSIFYSYATDNGKTFSSPTLISVVPGVYTFATRGPQIAATETGLVVTACTAQGNIYSFRKGNEGNWVKGGNVNDESESAKEGLMALSGDGVNVFAVWLDSRGNKRNKIYGAKSVDGGKTWSENKMIYASPDTHVCECCKPSVVIKGNNVYVMFRNWLKGSRDLYVIQSSNGGKTFGQAQKLGNGSWKLNGCPMDGGGLAVDKNGEMQTVWRREGKVYSSVPGKPEKMIGEGKGCTVETVNGKNVYAWAENGDIVIKMPQGQRKVLGKGSLPVLEAVNNEEVICVWQNENQIHAENVEL